MLIKTKYEIKVNSISIFTRHALVQPAIIQAGMKVRYVQDTCKQGKYGAIVSTNSWPNKGEKGESSKPEGLRRQAAQALRVCSEPE